MVVGVTGNSHHENGSTPLVFAVFGLPSHPFRFSQRRPILERHLGGRYVVHFKCLAPVDTRPGFKWYTKLGVERNPPPRRSPVSTPDHPSTMAQVEERNAPQLERYPSLCMNIYEECSHRFSSPGILRLFVWLRVYCTSPCIASKKTSSALISRSQTGSGGLNSSPVACMYSPSRAILPTLCFR